MAALEYAQKTGQLVEKIFFERELGDQFAAGFRDEHHTHHVIEAVPRTSFGWTLVNSLKWSTQWYTRTISHRHALYGAKRITNGRTQRASGFLHLRRGKRLQINAKN